MVILVTGGNGQLGQALRFISEDYPEIHFHFADSQTADITNLENLRRLFSNIKPDFCINAAAYTAVDKAESEPEKAHLINVTGAANLAKASSEAGTTLIHISTDFVFDGTKDSPYTELDTPNPTGVYGRTKLQGEMEIAKSSAKYFIVRTSWVFSQFGNNFMKTMLRLAGERDFLTVVNDQVGTPTHAVELAKALVAIASSASTQYGLYHFSNLGQASWFDFAVEIMKKNGLSTEVRPVPTASFPTAAKRPAYSVLDKSKIESTFKISIAQWQDTIKKGG